jgi:hypothetical protein
MTQSNDLPMERVRRLLAHEGAFGGSSEALAVAAERIHDKLTAHLSPLLGSAGVQALFVRSVKLARLGLAPTTDVPVLASSTDLSTFLRQLEPAVATNVAEALFATFLALMATFIGERLTHQALRSAWPTLEEEAPSENRK